LLIISGPSEIKNLQKNIHEQHGSIKKAERLNAAQLITLKRIIFISIKISVFEERQKQTR
tara:strand:- start:666 stop:845 length:180 start_codon:yes stop_codon:yes gene_type:complete